MLMPEKRAEVQARVTRPGQTVSEVLQTMLLNGIENKHKASRIVALDFRHRHRRTSGRRNGGRDLRHDHAASSDSLVAFSRSDTQVVPAWHDRSTPWPRASF